MQVRVSVGVFLLIALVSTCQGQGIVTLGFTERDYTPDTGKNNTITVQVSGSGSNLETIFVQIIPLTFSQAENLPDNLCSGISLGTDNPAEEDDFDTTIQTITIPPDGVSLPYDFEIRIIENSVLKSDEIFLIVLNTTSTETETVQTQIGCAIGRIRNIIDPDTKIVNITSLTTGSLNVSENAGVIHLYNITKIVDSELPINIHIELVMTTVAVEDLDFSIPNKNFVISPNDYSGSVSVNIMDDNLAEDLESFQIRVTASLPTTSIREEKIVKVNIIDDEVVLIGFMNETEYIVTEGEMVKLCAGYINFTTQNYERFRGNFLLSTKNGTAKANIDYIPVQEEIYSPYANRPQCYTIETIDNNEKQPLREFTFSFDSGQEDSGTVFEPSSVRLVILDNDDAPLAPKISSFIVLEDKSISLTWTSETRASRPIDYFTGIIRVGQIPPEGRNKVKIINFNVTQMTTSYIIREQELDKMYEATVCAENKIGQNCSDPQLLNIPTSFPLSTTNGKVPPGLIAIIIVIVVVLILFCCLLLFILLFCLFCRRDREKSYYPAKAVAKELRGKSPDSNDSFDEDEDEFTYKES